MPARGKDKGWFVLWTLFPFGMATWAVFAHAGRRARNARWKAFAVVYGIASYAALVYSSIYDAPDGDDSFAGMLIIVPWVVGIGHALYMRPEYLRQRDRQPSALEQARARLQTREEAMRIAREEPALALEMGIGRPDRPGAMHAGLIDVNGAPVEAIERLPGLGRAEAEQVVKVRQELGGFSTLEDLGMTLDLPGDVVEDLRDKTVFLPR